MLATLSKFGWRRKSVFAVCYLEFELELKNVDVIIIIIFNILVFVW